MEETKKDQFKPVVHTTTILEGPVRLPKSTHVEPYCVFSIGETAKLYIGEKNTFYPSVVIRNSVGLIETGSNVSFGPGVSIYEVRGGLKIGNNTMIAAGVSISGTHHGTERGMPMRYQKTTVREIIIGDDVWIGMNSVIHPGVTIGDGTIIGSGSVVTRSIPAMSVAMGVPCKVRRGR